MLQTTLHNPPNPPMPLGPSPFWVMRATNEREFTSKTAQRSLKLRINLYGTDLSYAAYAEQ